MTDEFEKLERPRVEALDAILGDPFRVLDDGFVRVVDYMGSDESIVQAARVSYGKGTKKISEDRGLIRYLLRHRHTTPFEMCDIKFHVRVPMDCWRQWIRHRTACLAEGTDIYFDLPGGIKRRGTQLYKLKIEEIWRRFQPTKNAQRPDKQRNPFFRRDRLRAMRLRQVNEDTHRLQHTNLVNVYKNGSKPVFRVTLEDGKRIEATADHKFLFEDGWNTLRGATGLCERNGNAIWRQGTYRLHVNGLEVEVPGFYRDRGWLNEQYNVAGRKIQDIADACGVSYHTIRKWIRTYNLQHAKGGRSKAPWNRGKTYKLAARTPSKKLLEAIQAARSGPASNFWKGGLSSERDNIGRWTTQVAAKIHARNGWTCQLCRQRTKGLHCHHIVPVWADSSLAREESNLTSICIPCHKRIHGRELEYVEKFDGPPVHRTWRKRPQTARHTITVSKLVAIRKIEFVGVKMTYDIEVAGPYHNFIANGIVTHNSVNEYSTRYSIAIDATQTTPPSQWRIQSKSSKQGSEGFLDEKQGAALSKQERDFQDASRRLYEERLEHGVAREQARKDLPLSTYTEAYWKANLHNLLHFLALRMDAHAQLEIRQYARTIGEEIVAKWVPITWEAFMDYRMNSLSFSGLEAAVVAAIGDGNMAEAMEIAAANGWLKRGEKGWVRNRERKELEDKLARLNLPVPWRQDELVTQFIESRGG